MTVWLHNLDSPRIFERMTPWALSFRYLLPSGLITALAPIVDKVTTMVVVIVYLVGAAVLFGRLYRHRRLTREQTTRLLARLQSSPAIDPAKQSGIALDLKRASK
jgi:hypothetical protein